MNKQLTHLQLMVTWKDLMIILGWSSFGNNSRQGRRNFLKDLEPRAFTGVLNKVLFDFKTAVSIRAWPTSPGRWAGSHRELFTCAPSYLGSQEKQAKHPRSTNIYSRWRCAKWLSLEFWATENIVEGDSENTWEHVLLPSPRRWMTSEASGIPGKRSAGLLWADLQSGTSFTLLAH